MTEVWIANHLGTCSVFAGKPHWNLREKAWCCYDALGRNAAIDHSVDEEVITLLVGSCPPAGAMWRVRIGEHNTMIVLEAVHRNAVEHDPGPYPSYVAQ